MSNVGTSIAASSPASVTSVAHPLRDSKFRTYWIGWAISFLGDQFYLVALPWLVLQQTGSVIAMSTVLMATALPRAVLMLIGGALTDRMSPRRILMGTASARAVLVTAIGACVWFHLLHMWELYVLAFAFGVADAFAFPAGQKLLPSLVEPKQLVAANSVFASTAQLTTIVAPPPAGILIKLMGMAWAFFVDAISFLFVIGALWKLPDPVQPQIQPAKKAMWSSILEGLRYVVKDVPLCSLMIVATLMNFCTAGPIGIGLPYLVKTKFNSPAAYGIVLSSVAAGGLLGSLLAGVWRVRRRGIMLLTASAVLGVLVGSIGLLKSLWMISVVLLVMGIAAGLTNVHIASWVQQRVEIAVRGRVLSVLMLSSIGLAPISLAIAGALIVFSLKFTFLLAGASMVIAALLAALQKTVRAIE